MKIVKRKGFTQWWFHNLSEGIRHHHKVLDKAENNGATVKTDYQTWTRCLARNKRKVEMIYQEKRLYGKAKNDEWKYCISWQKKKLSRLWDELESWRKLEGKLLERMNRNNFPYNQAPNILWVFKVYKQSMKVKKLYLKSHTRNSPEVWTWGHVLKRIRYRYKRKYQEVSIKQDDLWTINLKANKLKIQTIHLRSEWVQCIFKNREKIRYSYYEHSKKNSNGYSHYQFE